jgi:RNA polymerase sigma factor (sigma-70 family)
VSDRTGVEGLLRELAPRALGAVVRRYGHFADAEDAVQEALVAAATDWPAHGLPENLLGWLVRVASRRMADRYRSDEARRRREDLAASWSRAAPEPGSGRDDTLALFFMCCHPSLPAPSAVGLTLRALGGLTTREIATAFLVPEATMAQRISRAKRTVAESDEPLSPLGADAAAERLAPVLRVIYLVFNEGYAATAGEDWTRPELCEDALRLGRILAELMPREAEVHGLAALMELQASRLRARRAPDGSPVLLLDQDRSRWDLLLIGRGLKALDRAEALSAGGLGPYTLQAAIAACHARARVPELTDWERIVALYDGLAALTGSPVVELNRAVAVAMTFGPAAGLELVDALAGAPELAGYHLLPSVRADLLERLGRRDEAYAELTRAAGLAGNERERRLLLERAAAMAGGG